MGRRWEDLLVQLKKCNTSTSLAFFLPLPPLGLNTNYIFCWKITNSLFIQFLLRSKCIILLNKNKLCLNCFLTKCWFDEYCMYANPDFRVACLPRIRCLRSSDWCLIAKVSKHKFYFFYFICLKLCKAMMLLLEVISCERTPI